jgi:hypothetical protein
LSDNASESLFARNLTMLEHFRHQLKALSEKTTLELLRAFQDKPFMNAEARRVLGARRQATWSRLALLVQLGLVQKRGHVYRLSPFSRDFVNLSASTLQSLMTGQRPPPTTEAKEALEASRQGLEMLFSKGRLKQDEYSRYIRVLAELMNGNRT